MSGWENVPDEAPKQPRAPRKRQAAAAALAEPDAKASDAMTAEDGEFARHVDLYWPQAWITMLTIVCLIATWAAIGKLPNHPSWWP